MLRLAFEEKNIKAKTILFDNWYAASENLKYIHRNFSISHGNPDEQYRLK